MAKPSRPTRLDFCAIVLTLVGLDSQKREATYFIVTRMSKQASALFASEPVEVLVYQHVVVETVLSRERRVTQ